MDMVNISVSSAAVVVFLGMGVVFLGLFLLMLVVQLMSRIMIASQKKTHSALTTAPSLTQGNEKPEKALGSAGEIKLYDTDPRDAAMIMAIVAEKIGKPLNELRFKSIRKIK